MNFPGVWPPARHRVHNFVVAIENFEVPPGWVPPWHSTFSNCASQREIVTLVGGEPSVTLLPGEQASYELMPWGVWVLQEVELDSLWPNR